jgi:hypothetical protein
MQQQIIAIRNSEHPALRAAAPDGPAQDIYAQKKGLLIWLMLTTRWDVKPGGMDDSARSSNIRQN